jgi:hypothetical protein
MSGHPVPDEAARLEAALERIARAATHAQQAREHAAPAQVAPMDRGLPDHGPHATNSEAAAETAAVAARLDALIADLRAVLGTQG